MDVVCVYVKLVIGQVLAIKREGLVDVLQVCEPRLLGGGRAHEALSGDGVDAAGSEAEGVGACMRPAATRLTGVLGGGLLNGAWRRY